MVVKCFIKFDNNNGIYFAGQLVTGKIIFQTDKPKKVRAVQLKIKGFAHTRWTEETTCTTSTGNGSTMTTTISTTYSGHEDYIKTTIHLMRSKKDESAIIQPGKQVFNFSGRIPDRCPTSFECQYGHIRYMVKVVLIRPWKFNQSYTKGFTVLNIVNLNLGSPCYRAPTQRAVQKKFCCWPCGSDPMFVNVNLPQGGYVPGQKIPVGVLITNESSKKIKEIKAELVMNVRCFSQSPSKHTKNERTVLRKYKAEAEVLRQSKKLFVYNLTVPATPPTCMDKCSIIQISYAVEVVVKMHGMHNNTKVSVPVTIGSVPIAGGMIRQQPRPAAGAIVRVEPSVAVVENVTGTSAAGAVVAVEVSDKALEAAGSEPGEKNEINLQAQAVTGENEDQVPSYSGAMSNSSPWQDGDGDIAPPSYEAATHIPRAKITEDEKHDFGESDFVPHYPLYSIASPTAPTMEEVLNRSAAAAEQNASF